MTNTHTNKQHFFKATIKPFNHQRVTKANKKKKEKRERKTNKERKKKMKETFEKLCLIPTIWMLIIIKKAYFVMTTF